MSKEANDKAAKAAAARAAFTDEQIEIYAGVAYDYLAGWYHHNPNDHEPVVPLEILRDAIKYALKEWEPDTAIRASAIPSR
jgi:hypothetical protein